MAFSNEMKRRISGSGLTGFQKLVLLETAKIPKGETITYGELARRIGRPGAVRAVGSALAKNPFAPELPCHRVVAKNGIGGYSGKGGVERKRRLLSEEKAILA